MATILGGVCSECFTPQQIEISPRYPHIECEFCGHSVPMFEKREIAAIRGGLAAERRKMYIALLLLAGAVFLFGLYVSVNIRFAGDPVVEITTADGETISGALVARDDDSITIRTPSGEPKYTFLETYRPDVEKLVREKPYLSEELAASLVGAKRVVPEIPETKASILFILAILAGLAAVAFSFIAGQDKVVAEF